MFYSLGILLLVAATNQASLLRNNNNRALGLFQQCTFVGMQCSAESNSICTLIRPASSVAERTKRDADFEQPQVLEEAPANSARSGAYKADNNDADNDDNNSKEENNSNSDNNHSNNNSGNNDDNNKRDASDNNNNDSGNQNSKYAEYKVVKAKTKILPTIYKNTSKTNVINTVQNIYKNINTRSRVDVHQNVVQKRVLVHTINNIHKDLTVNHLQQNHRTDIIKHVHPYLNKLYITRRQDIIQPYQKTVITRSETKRVKDIVHPTIVDNQYKTERLKTVYEPVKDLGVVDLGNNRDRDNNNNDDNNAYQLQERSGLTINAANAATLARFKRSNMNEGYQAYCICPMSYVPDDKLMSCVCPAGKSVQLDGFCA